MSCKTCQPMPVCIEGVDDYSLQKDIFYFVLVCPPGEYCGGVNVISVICCDGKILSVTIPENTSQTIRNQIIQAMLQEYARRLPFCECTQPDCRNGGGGGGGGTTEPPVLYYSAAANCNWPCPNGEDFIAYVQAGRFIAGNQAAADRAAQNLACQLAREGQLCIDPFDIDICMNEAYERTVRVTGRGVRNMQKWDIIDGSLPPGLTLPSHWINGTTNKISGTPTTAGSYTFGLKVTAQSGRHTFVTCHICVIGIPTLTLPNAQQGVAYSYTLTAPACVVTPITWDIDPSTPLPNYLVLNSQTGVISGTPEANGQWNGKLAVCDKNGKCCIFNCTLTIGQCNDERSGTGFCPGDPSKLATVTVPECTFIEDDKEIANASADEYLVNQIAASLTAQGCACTVTVNGKEITNTCLTGWLVRRSDGGLLAPIPQPVFAVASTWRLDINYAITVGLPLPPDVYTFEPASYGGPNFTIDFRT